MVESVWVEGAVRTGSGRSRRITFFGIGVSTSLTSNASAAVLVACFFVVVVEMDFPRALRQGASKPGQ